MATNASSLHLDAVSVAAAIDAAATAAAGAIHATTVANAVTTGVTTPANAAYTQADQTALADAVLDLATKFNTLLTNLRAKGVIL